MKQETKTLRVITADEGMYLIQADETLENRAHGKKAFLGSGDSAENWTEITLEQAEGMGLDVRELADEEMPKGAAMDLIINQEGQEPMLIVRRKALKIRDMMLQIVRTMTIDEIGDFAEQLPHYKWDGQTTIPAGTIFTYEGKVKMSLNTITDQPQWKPSAENEGQLFISVEYHNGVRCIPERFYGASDAFHLNSLGYWKGKVYKALQEGLAYTPDVTPQLWEEQHNN